MPEPMTHGRRAMLSYNDGDLVVITGTGNCQGMVGIVSIDIGWETVGVKCGCIHARVNPDEVRRLTSSDRVAL